MGLLLAAGSPPVPQIYAVGIESLESIGSHALSVSVFPNGIPSSVSFGSASLGLNVEPVGIASNQSIGLPLISANVTAGNILSGEAFGLPVISYVHSINANGILSSEALGNAGISVLINANGIVSAEAIGHPLVGDTGNGYLVITALGQKANVIQSIKMPQVDCLTVMPNVMVTYNLPSIIHAESKPSISAIGVSQ